MLIQVQFKVLEILIVAALYYLLMTTLWAFPRPGWSASLPGETSGPAHGSRRLRPSRPSACKLRTRPEATCVKTVHARCFTFVSRGYCPKSGSQGDTDLGQAA